MKNALNAIIIIVSYMCVVWCVHTWLTGSADQICYIIYVFLMGHAYAAAISPSFVHQNRCTVFYGIIYSYEDRDRAHIENRFTRFPNPKIIVIWCVLFDLVRWDYRHNRCRSQLTNASGCILKHLLSISSHKKQHTENSIHFNVVRPLKPKRGGKEMKRQQQVEICSFFVVGFLVAVNYLFMVRPGKEDECNNV